MNYIIFGITNTATMGAWGTAISSNDTYSDIYSEFCDLYNDGLSVSEITQKLISENSGTTSDPDDANNFWFAIAKAQWDYKSLDPEIYNRVKNIIESGNDLDVWRNLEASESDIKKRKEVLDKFLLTLQSEKPKAKAKKKIKIGEPAFEKGECITFRLKNGNYGGAVVIEADLLSKLGLNLIATTQINQPEKPSLKDFEEADVLILNHSSWADHPHICWIFPYGYKEEIAPFIEKAGSIEVHKEYDYDALVSTYSTGPFHCILQANMQFESEESKPKSTVQITIKGLTKKKSWKFW